MKKLLFLLTIFAFLFLISCNEEAPVEQNASIDKSLDKKGGNTIGEQIQGMMTAMNAKLEADGKNYRVAMAEYITNGDGNEVGNTVLSKVVGNKQLDFDFVPFDDRREWSGSVDGSNDNITYAIDQTTDAVPLGGGLTAAETDAAIVRAMNTWDGLNTDLDLTRNDDFGIDIGVVANILSGGAIGSPFIFADVQHAGWRDLDFSGGVLGVTYTFGFTSAPGVFTDVDNNGKADCAFREIYYDPSWNWADDGSSNIDVESVALHEAGHGLSQAHFGTVRIKNDGTLQASPWAVMNALYAAPRRELEGTDKGGHSSIWGSWPNN